MIPAIPFKALLDQLLIRERYFHILPETMTRLTLGLFTH